MLHKIQLPACREHLDWIVQLQRRLLAALCRPDLSGPDVTVDWVVAQLSDLDVSWVRAFCNRKDQIKNVERPLLEHMQIIAVLSAADKTSLLNAFENDQKFPSAFEPQPVGPHRLIGLTPFLEDIVATAIRGFFEIFYAPNFYAKCGYLIPQANGDFVTFHKDEFLSRYREANPDVLVCPYCDGDLGSPQVDHFYPKSDYPYLSCHPLNLVPICPTCNSRENKGTKAPLARRRDPQHDSKYDWFHPYLRSAHDQYEIRFERLPEGLIPALRSDDQQTQIRLDNLDILINLKARWRSALMRKIRATMDKVRYQRAKIGEIQSKAQLQAKLAEWAEEYAIWDIGREGFGLVGARYLQSAAAGEPDVFDELWIYYTQADAVTGNPG
jgi:hypothetical protein